MGESCGEEALLQTDYCKFPKAGRGLQGKILTWHERSSHEDRTKFLFRLHWFWNENIRQVYHISLNQVDEKLSNNVLGTALSPRRCAAIHSSKLWVRLLLSVTPGAFRALPLEWILLSALSLKYPAWSGSHAPVSCFNLWLLYGVILYQEPSTKNYSFPQPQFIELKYSPPQVQVRIIQTVENNTPHPHLGIAVFQDYVAGLENIEAQLLSSVITPGAFHSVSHLSTTFKL